MAAPAGPIDPERLEAGRRALCERGEERGEPDRVDNHEERDKGGDEGGEGPVASNPPAALRFIVTGDSGSGSGGQYAVGEAIAEVCQGKNEFVDDMAFPGCDLVVGLGDNIYESGVTSVDDPQFAEKFENIHLWQRI